MYYILSLKWSRGAKEMVWYRPNCRGYTIYLQAAGQYTKDMAQRKTQGGRGVVKAIPCAIADTWADSGGVVLNESRITSSVNALPDIND